MNRKQVQDVSTSLLQNVSGPLQPFLDYKIDDVTLDRLSALLRFGCSVHLACKEVRGQCCFTILILIALLLALEPFLRSELHGLHFIVGWSASGTCDRLCAGQGHQRVAGCEYSYFLPNRLFWFPSADMLPPQIRRHHGFIPACWTSRGKLHVGR